MPKQCKQDECHNPVWGGGYCRNHQHLRTDKKPKPMRKVSRNRADELGLYEKLCKDVDEQHTVNGKVVCFFCEKPIEGFIDHHHTCGRAGDNYLNGVVPLHPACHRAELGGYHILTYKQLASMPYIHKLLAYMRDVDESKWGQKRARLRDAGMQFVD